MLRPTENGVNDESTKQTKVQKGKKNSKKNGANDSEELNDDAVDLDELSVSFYQIQIV